VPWVTAAPRYQTDDAQVKTRLLLVVALSLFSINWTIRDLGTLPGGGGSFAMAINNHGEIVGAARSSAGVQRAVVFEPGPIFEIPTAFGFGGSVASDINDNGLVVGQSPTGGFRHPLGGGVTSLGASTGAYAVNAFGDVGGYDSTPGSLNRALIWWGGSSSRFFIGILGSGNSSTTRDLADGKAAAGSSRYEKGNPYHHAFLWSEGMMIDLGTLGGESSGADSLVVLHWPDPDHIATHVVGSAELASGEVHAFHWTAGSMADLGTLPGDSYSRALSINRSKIAVGFSQDSSMNMRAVMWDSTIVDLNTLLPPDSGWVLTIANGINDLGQIVGAGLHKGVLRAFVLTP
jgi:probable HAF family extracellular repeat protein